MSSFKDLTRAVSYKYNDKINKYCSPLFKYFNLFQFFYYEIKNDGRFSSFHSSQGWSEYYDANQFYLQEYTDFLKNHERAHEFST